MVPSDFDGEFCHHHNLHLTQSRLCNHPYHMTPVTDIYYVIANPSYVNIVREFDAALYTFSPPRVILDIMKIQCSGSIGAFEPLTPHSTQTLQHWHSPTEDF